MKKIFTFLSAMLLSVAFMQAQTDYGIIIAGTYITPENYNDVRGAGIGAAVLGSPYKISYNPTKKILTLTNVSITVASNNNVAGIYVSNYVGNLTIKLVNKNNIKMFNPMQYAGVNVRSNTTIEGPGSMDIYNHEGEGMVAYKCYLSFKNSCTVTSEGSRVGIMGNGGNINVYVDGSTLKAKGSDGAFRYVNIYKTYSDCDVTSPAGAYVSHKLNGVALNGKLVKNQWVEIRPVTKYSLYVGGERVHSGNISNITGDGIKGRARATKSTNRFDVYLENAELTDGAWTENDATNLIVVRGDEELHVNLTGINKLKYYQDSSYPVSGINADKVYIKGAGSLDIDVSSKSGDSWGVVFYDEFRNTGQTGKLTIRNADIGLEHWQKYAGKVYLNDNVEIMSEKNAISFYKTSTFSTNAGLKFVNSVPNGPGVYVDDITFWNIDSNFKGTHKYLRTAKGQAYPLWVAGHRITSENASRITGTGITGTVRYSGTSNTLTLSNAKISNARTWHSGSSGECINAVGIYSTSNLQVNLVGNNIIDYYLDGLWGYADDYFGRGILATGKLTIKGTGTLTIKRIYSDVDAVYGGIHYALNAKGIEIDRATVINEKAGNITKYVDTDKQAFVLKNSSTFKTDGAIIDLPAHPTVYNGAVLEEGDSKATMKKVKKLTLTEYGSGYFKTKSYVTIRPVGTDVETLTSQGIQVQGVKSAIRISIDTDEHKYASIYNLTGSLIRVAELEGKETTIGNMQPGIYIVRIGNAAEKVVVK